MELFLLAIGQGLSVDLFFVDCTAPALQMFGRRAVDAAANEIEEEPTKHEELDSLPTCANYEVIRKVADGSRFQLSRWHGDLIHLILIRCFFGIYTYLNLAGHR